MNKKIPLLILSLTLILGVGLFYYVTKFKEKNEPKKELAQKATAINYKGAMVVNKVENINDIMAELNLEAPAGGGTFDLKTMAASITAEALKAFSNSQEKSLPLVSSWNTGIPVYVEAMDPMYMISRIEKGEHILVSWHLDPYYDEGTGYDYYEASIKKAAELGLPLVFVLPAPESALSLDSVYQGMDAKENPNVVNKQGEVLNKLSPFGPNKNWKDVGEQWASSDIMAQIQEWYPNPTLVMFVSEDTVDKLTWQDIDTSSRYALTGKDDNYKRTLIGAQWIEKYRQMHEGFKTAFTKKAWKENVKFITRNKLSENLGANKDWIDSATVTNLYANIWPLTADAVNVDFSLNTNQTDSKANAPHILANNLPFMLSEAKTVNPKSASQLSINADSILDDPARYRGLTQFALWFLRPSFVRQESLQNTREDLEKTFQEVADSVELIHYNDSLADFWRNGTLVKSGTSNLNTNIPAQYANDPRWFLLDTDANPKRPWTNNTAINVWAFALVKGEAPNREWLVYVQSPDGNKTDVTVSVPEYKDVLVDASAMGSFYVLNENTKKSEAIATKKELTRAERLKNVLPRNWTIEQWLSSGLLKEDPRVVIDTTGAVNVKDAPYNAVGDGIADDTAAIQSALNDSPKVYIPAGVYNVTGNIYLTSATTLLYGEGELLYNGSKNYISIIRTNGVTLSGKLTIDGITFNHQGTGLYGASLSFQRARNNFNTTVQNCTFKNSKDHVSNATGGSCYTNAEKIHNERFINNTFINIGRIAIEITDRNTEPDIPSSSVVGVKILYNRFLFDINSGQSIESGGNHMFASLAADQNTPNLPDDERLTDTIFRGNYIENCNIALEVTGLKSTEYSHNTLVNVNNPFITSNETEDLSVTYNYMQLSNENLWVFNGTNITMMYNKIYGLLRMNSVKGLEYGYNEFTNIGGRKPFQLINGSKTHIYNSYFKGVNLDASGSSIIGIQDMADSDIVVENNVGQENNSLPLLKPLYIDPEAILINNIDIP